MIDLSNLNERQKEAVITTEGPVMVMAGAGSGKTKVLTTRIAYIIDELGIYPQDILAVTFTNKASNEMKERIGRILDINTKSMWVSTFHAFASRLLRMEIDNLYPYTRYFNIIDEDDALKIIKGIIKEKNINYSARNIKNAISSEKNGNPISTKDKEFFYAYKAVMEDYNKHLENENLLDFDDLILKTIELFKKNPSILRKYQEKFQYILVDEFQDTNSLQYDLMYMLAAKYHNIFVVGDDFQSIYSFRGAKIENINKFRRDYIESKLILLEKNYRSTTQILDLANDVIKNNPNQIKKTMYSNGIDGKKPLFYRTASDNAEAQYVVDEITKMHQNGSPYSDFAIMYRSNFISRKFEDALVKSHIPYVIYGGMSFFQRAEIKDIIAYLRLIVNTDDDFSFERIINTPKRGIGNSFIDKLKSIKEEKSNNLFAGNDNVTSLFSAIDFYQGSGKGYTNLKQFKEDILVLKGQIENESLTKLVDHILDDLGYDSYLKEDEETYDDRIQNVKEFKSALREVEKESTEETNELKLLSYLSDLALRTDHDNSSDKDAVILTTYHQAKGLEFDTVFMVATEEGIFPSIQDFLKEEIEEERRIFYVGVTRAKNNLYITCANQRYQYGNIVENSESRFIDELDRRLYDNYYEILKAKRKEKEKTKLEELKNKINKDNSKDKISWNLGDKINHKAFGDGMIVAINGNKLNVAFASPIGVKTIAANFPGIKKI